MKIFERFRKDHLLGVHLAVNMFIATAILWLVLRKLAGLNPIWAISAMIAAIDPHVTVAFQTFRARLTNALLGCVIGMFFLVVGGESGWKLPLALSVTALLSAYVVRVQTMWRQAPITAALILAAGLEQHSKMTGVEIGFRRVCEVIFGCVVGLTVTWIISRLWPLHEEEKT